ncbi:TusA-related sulfurtransferase [Parageobacillus thermantarcticus]|uniref:TusA-related sulfurtransferase n=1 Tax=Parageobacillus thermantarcticus TaxID=186116 RepID=A0A1I0SWT4_9BACL|nr:TusA-related sulfurtransferase [Parageobacillus thermantarcticus]
MRNHLNLIGVITVILDNRGLEPPQPMMRTLTALAKLQSGETLTIINDRRPMFLYEQLDELGYKHETIEREDGSFQITITKG